MAVKQVRASEAGQIAPANGSGNGRLFSVMDCHCAVVTHFLSLFLIVFLYVASSACSCMFLLPFLATLVGMCSIVRCEQMHSWKHKFFAGQQVRSHYTTICTYGMHEEATDGPTEHKQQMDKLTDATKFAC